MPSALLLCDDLIFTSRVVGEGRAHQIPFQTASNMDALLRNLATHHPDCVILDLQNPGLDIHRVVETIREGGPSVPFLVGYGSHVEVATLKKAREAGCDVVLPRSKFVEELPVSLPQWCSERASNA